MAAMKWSRAVRLDQKSRLTVSHVFGRLVWSIPEEQEPAAALEVCKRLLLLQKMLFFWILLARGRP